MRRVCEQDAEGMTISSAGLIIVACGMYNSCSSGLLIVRHSFSWPERPNETELAIRRDNISNVSGRVSAGTNLDAWFLGNKPAWMQVGPGEPGVSAPNTAQPRRVEQLSCDYRGLSAGGYPGASLFMPKLLSRTDTRPSKPHMFRAARYTKHEGNETRALLSESYRCACAGAGGESKQQ